MTLTADEFIRRFLLHVLPYGFHRIRHYGLIANAGRKDNLQRARELLMRIPADEGDDIRLSEQPSGDGQPQCRDLPTLVCPDCGAPMVVVDTFARRQLPRAPPLSFVAR